MNQHWILVEGLIDSEFEDPTHCTINFLSGDTLAKAYVLKGTNSFVASFQGGRFRPHEMRLLPSVR